MDLIPEEPWEFPSRRGNRLVGAFRPPATPAHGGVILCHGMESTKNGTKHIALSERFGRAGLGVLRFDFSYVGESEGEMADLTFSGEVDDLAGAWTAFRERVHGPVGLVGSSFGGAVALLFAAQEPTVAAVATIAAVGRPERILAEIRPTEIQQWRRDGIFSLGGIKLRSTFVDDIEQTDVLGGCAAIRNPVLVLHGAADGVVPVEDAHSIAAALGGEVEIDITPGADHRYSNPEHLAGLLDRIEHWTITKLGAAAL